MSIDFQSKFNPSMTADECLSAVFAAAAADDN
jgi:hypothetical protein